MINGVQWGTLNNGFSANRTHSLDLVALIQKEGTHNLTKNFQKFQIEDIDDDRTNSSSKKLYYFQSITALEGYKEFSIEELRRLDILAKKKGISHNNFGGSNYLSNNNLVSFYLILESK